MEERVYRRAKEMAVNELVNRKTDRTMDIAKRANRKAPDSLLHRWRLDKGAIPKILSRSILHRRKTKRIARQGKSP